MIIRDREFSSCYEIKNIPFYEKVNIHECLKDTLHKVKIYKKQMGLIFVSLRSLGDKLADKTLHTQAYYSEIMLKFKFF